MFFILQNEPVGRDPVQNAIIQDVLDHNKYSHSYEYVSIMDFYKDDTDEDIFTMKRVLKTPEDFDERYREAIPIGTVRFVEAYLRMFKGIERDNAIEIPPILRTDIIYFEDSDFAEFAKWLNGGFVSNLDEHDEPTDVSLLYEMMEDGMTWLRESEKNWIDFLTPGADECMYSKNPNVEYMLRNDRFGDSQKMNENDTIWWLDDLDRIGPRLFTFDLKEVFNFWSDYPDALTPEQKAVFDKECPGVAELKKELR